MASYSSTTGYISLYSGDPWETVTFPAITIASGEAFYRFKITKSNTQSGIEIQNSGKTQTLSYDTWYYDFPYIDSSWSAPKITARNTASTIRTTTFTLTVETNVTTKTITVNYGTGGTASASVNSATPGTTVTITSSPNTGYSANTPTSNVSGVTFTSAGANKWTFTMPNSNITVTCNFTHVSHTITVGVSPSGSGTLSANKSSAYYNDEVQLTRSATAGWQFSSWTKTPSGLVIGNNLKFTMPDANVSVTAVFTKINYSVSVGSSPEAGGTVTTNKATAQVGDPVTLTKTPSSGYQFSSWSTTPSLTINSSNQFTMPAANVIITANWSKINYSVTTNVASGSGTLSTNKSTAQIGDTVTITASPSAGYSTGTPSATGITFINAGTNKWTFTMPAGDVSVSISFSKITYTITKAVSPSGAGTVTAAATGQVGDQISVSQTPATGYYFNGWTFSPAGPSVSGGKFSMPANNVTVTANYLKRSTASVNTTSMTGGGSVTLTIVPDKTTYSHKYKLSFGTNMETSLTNVAAGTTSVTISVPESWSNYIPSAASKTGGTLLVETYSGNTKIGDYTITGLTYNVPASAVPTVGTCTTYVARTIDGTTYPNIGTNIFVQGKCGMRVTGSASGALGSSISKIEVTLSGYNDSGHKTTVNAASFDWTSALLTVSGTCTVTVKATDSRGRTATKTGTREISAYNRPSGTLTVYRVDNAGNTDPLGTYAKYSLTKAYTAVGSNSLSWSLTSQNVTASSPSDSGNILPSGRQSFSQTQEYTISLTLADAFETVTIQVTLPTAQFMFFFNATGDRLAFMKATNESLDKNGKNGTIEFSANHQMYIGNEKAEEYFTPDTVKSWLFRRIHYHATTTVNINGFEFNVASANYLWGTFIIHTRYSIHTLVFATDGNQTITVTTNNIVTGSGETLTATISGRTVTIISSMAWNYFDVGGTSSQEPSLFNFSVLPA